MQKKMNGMFWLSVGCFCATTAALLCIPAAITTLRRTTVWVVLTGAALWATVLLSYVSLLAAILLRRRLYRQRGRSMPRGKPGLLRFFSNLPAKCFDVLLLVSIALLIVVLLTRLKTTYLFYLSIALMWFSLNLHAMFNGTIYIDITREKRNNKEEKSFHEE